MATILLILVVGLLVAALVGAGGYTYRRYYSPAGTEVVETDHVSGGPGAGAAIAAIVMVVILGAVLLMALMGGWFGTHSNNQPTYTQPAPNTNPGVTNPLPSPASSPVTTTAPPATP